MAKKIKQFRYYAEGDPKNSPVASKDEYAKGTVFASVYPIAQLGIQALPGTQFFLNGSVKPITIGASGIYDLDIKNGARVTYLSFGNESMNRIAASDSSYLIVDVLYGEEGNN